MCHTSTTAPTSLDDLFVALPGKSARTVNTHDFKGNIVRTENYVHTGSVFSLAGWEEYSYNIMHKQLGSKRHDGTSEMSNWICTGPVWQRNADGTTVTNTFDTAKRISSSTRYTPFGNVTTTNSYNADGQIVSRSIATNGVTVGCGIGCGATYSEFDTQGRTVLAVDTIGRTNRTSYSLDNRTVTHTAPAGAVVVESYATDGTLLSRTGTVMRAEYYTQGVDAATVTRWEKITYGSPTGADYTKSHYNALGQLVSQERPGFGGATLKTVYAYNAKGQLESETRLVQGGTGTYDLPVTTYAYNQLGDRTSTTQTAANVSRIQSSDSTFSVDNNIVRQTSISVASCSDATILPMTNSVITRLWPLGEDADGLLAESSQFDVRGNETVQKVVQNSTTYERTITVSNATSVLPAISISLAGLTLSSKDQHGCTTIYGYDALMRQISAETRSGASNERLTGTYTHYNVIGQVDYTEDALGVRTVYGYEPGTGRRISTTQYGQGSDPSLSTYTVFDQANRPLATWGATYPVAYEYDTAGRMTAMYTYRGTAAISKYSDIAALKPQMDRTQWFYDQATGLLTNKLYADGKGPAYSYTALGQLSTRIWARPSGTGQQLLTLYKYDSFGGLTNTAYSDGTPSVAFIYDALGRQKVAQTFLSASGEIVSCTTNTYSDFDLVAEIQNGVRIDKQVDAFGRPKGLAIGQDYAVEYGFDEYGRFKSVQSAQFVATNLFTYSYIPGSHLISGYTATQPVSSFEFQASKNYEPNRDLITTVSNTFGSATISAFGYENDGFGRRTARIDTTPTLTVNNAFGYNLKSEVTSATMGENAYNYDYDPIGNRIYAAFNADTNTYSANALNQYVVITNSVSSVPPCLINPSYDADGNMLTNGVWSYSWDAENRLSAVYSNDTLLVSNVYDHQSRRIAKIISRSGAEAQRRVFVWDGWNLVSEVRSQNSEVSTNYYTWGLDLSGTLQGAGGVGGLLAVHRDSTSYFPCFDANGNATEYIDATGAIRAHYAFDAFGNTIIQSGDMACDFSHRFSTTYYDPVTTLYYYGCRYYTPELGRWVSRDPVEEMYSWSVYIFLDNETIDSIDERGLLKSNPGNRVEAPITPKPPPPPPITKGLPPLSPLLPTTPATTKAEGAAGITGVLIDVVIMVTDRPVAVMKGINMCWSQRPYAIPPPSSTPSISARPCKCCVITIRKEGTEGLPMYILKSAIVVDKYCEDLENGGGHGTISAPGTEYLYLNWR
jgi:RHS repeat-associated protein